MVDGGMKGKRKGEIMGGGGRKELWKHRSCRLVVSKGEKGRKEKEEERRKERDNANFVCGGVEAAAKAGGGGRRRKASLPLLRSGAQKERSHTNGGGEEKDGLRSRFPSPPSPRSALVMI